MRVMTGEYRRPFAEFTELTFEFQIIIQTAKTKLRPTIPPQCPTSLAALIQQSWEPETGTYVYILY
jgi:hypothetical protein